MLDEFFLEIEMFRGNAIWIFYIHVNIGMFGRQWHIKKWHRDVASRAGL